MKLTAREVDKFVGELGAIVEYVEQIDSADIEGLKPTDQVTGLKNVTRADKTIDYQASREDLLANAPQRDDGYIKVKRIIK